MATQTPRLDRRITLLIPSPTTLEDDYGHEQPVADPMECEVWAQRIDAMPRDQLRYDNEARLNVNQAVFVIRYRDDVEAGKMMIDDDEGQRRRIIGRAPMKRRMRYLALLCEEIK